MFRRLNEKETESERQLGKWGFALRGDPHVAYGIWDHWEDNRSIILYDDDSWQLVVNGVGAAAVRRGTASLIKYLRENDHEQN